MEYGMNAHLANGLDVLDWFAAGAREVAAHVKYLNAINVFPVADGDTGTNLYATLRAMVEKPPRAKSFSGMMQGISQSGLDNARGNSGTIFASYISGLAIESRSYEEVGVSEFAAIAFRAVKHLYEAVEHPVEGTLMSIIRDWATFLERNQARYRSFQELFHDAYHSATASLEKTKVQLSVLKKHGVVDSGAAGFVRFLQGINRAFAHGRTAEEAEVSEVPVIATEEESAAFRYCTEALLDVHSAEAALIAGRVKDALAPLGDSMIVTGRDRRLKVHIHTNSPEAVMERLAEYGALIEQKADDMHLQSRLRTMEKGGIGLVTDSIADIPDEFKLEHRIATLPMGVMVNGAAFLDKQTIGLHQLFREMEKPEGYPTSAQPEPGRIAKLLEMMLERFDSLIVLSVSSALSGTFQALRQAARQLEAEGKRVTVVDTLLNSGAQGLLVKEAAELVQKGFGHDEVVGRVRALIPRSKIYVCLNTLAYAVRGGRVPDTVGKLGMKLGLRPIMTLDKRGHGAAFGVAFSQAGLTRKILRLVRKTQQRPGIRAYGIVHGDNLSLATEYAGQLARIIGKEPAFISEISSVVALHAGPGTVAVCLTEGGDG